MKHKGVGMDEAIPVAGGLKCHKWYKTLHGRWVQIYNSPMTDHGQTIWCGGNGRTRLRFYLPDGKLHQPAVHGDDPNWNLRLDTETDDPLEVG